MHSPMDVSAKVDVWELYRGFKAFLGAPVAAPMSTAAR
jgi:aspartyl aminopeptidase